MKHFLKIFDNPSEVNQAMSYYLNLVKKVKKLGYSSECVEYYEDDYYRGNHSYPDKIEVYINTDDEVIITSLKIVI